ncbi:pyridoxamine 5'-phosphate oxidase family protein [Anaerocolumna sp. AGMB13020]|uniref:pyridoxamine 5'-phosphate oxidase family protein n=1 Tax=Anaerocolumna sp. AGMB13020 TaxID=3081750 RepID=UPI002953E464|nr:pyridoxamine 5'-phosphate oxidase family protein [Anaerocolumna sp. AGMB13020]WOO37057.1 pyridoxamine 5'-phosphate oxidase family protein [Anaerocolumna sp. AGMB13020]
MEYTEKYQEIVQKAYSIALATAIDNKANIRCVSSCFDPVRPSVIYFSTNRNMPKVTEFARNNEVAFTTVPAPADGHIHVRSQKATVHKSDFTIDELKDMFITQIPGFERTLEMAGRFLDVYEIHVKEAIVVLGPMQTGTVTF